MPGVLGLTFHAPWWASLALRLPSPTGCAGATMSSRQSLMSEAIGQVARTKNIQLSHVSRSVSEFYKVLYCTYTKVELVLLPPTERVLPHAARDGKVLSVRNPDPILHNPCAYTQTAYLLWVVKLIGEPWLVCVMIFILLVGSLFYSFALDFIYFYKQY